jgi:hypothetical protein
MKIRIAIGLGATVLDADTFTAVVTSLGPLGFDPLWISAVLTGPAPDPLVALAIAASSARGSSSAPPCCCPDATSSASPSPSPASTC